MRHSIHPHRPWARLLPMGLAILALPAPGGSGGAVSVPLTFVPNAGQTDPAVLFQAHTLGGTLFFTPSEVILALPQTAPATRPPATGRDLSVGSPRDGSAERGVPVRFLRLHFPGASGRPEIVGAERLPGTFNSFRGSDPARWRSDLPTYAAIVYRDLYPGIDLRYEGVEGRIKGTWHVEPGADPSRIRWAYAGARETRIDRAGNLQIEAGPATVVFEKAPTAWQEVAGRRVPVPTRYARAADGSISFALPRGYDSTQPLILDPTLTYSTFLAGGAEDVGYSVAVDASGAAYVAGYTFSTDFPTKGALDPGCGSDGNCDGFAFADAFVAKLNPSVSGAASLVFSTYLGGSGNDFGVRIAVDGAGASYVTGIARAGFPTTANAFQQTFGGGTGSDAFLTKLSANGAQLLYSTYIGGSNGDGAWGLALDASGNAYLIGQSYSVNFPTTVGSLDTSCGTDGACNGASDAFVAKLNPGASGAASLVYSTYIGGSGDDQGYGIALDAANNAYVTGRTTSTNFPTAGVPYQSTNAGDFDAFVAKLNAAGSALSYSTYLGGSGYDDGYSIALGASNRAYVVGTTFSGNLPTTAGAFQPSFGGLDDAYLSKVDPAAAGAASLVYSTYVGGSDDDEGFGLAVDGSDIAYVTGFALSTGLPTAGGPFQPVNGGSWDAFVMKVDPALSGAASLLYATYLGGLSTDAGFGLALDASRNIYVTGQTYSSASFPTVNPFQATAGGGSDAFVLKIDNATTSANLGVGQTDSPDPVAAGSNVTYTITVTNGGPGAAAGVRLTDMVAGSATLVSATPTQGTCTTVSFNGEQGVSCELGSLASAATATLSLVVTPAEGTITSTARVSSNVSDPNALNNTASESTTVTSTADLSITKTDGQAAAVPGTPITYTIIASNAGPSSVTGATVADALPGTITGAAWTCVGDGGGTCPGSGSGSINETVDLPAGGTVTYTLTGTISASATGSLSNTATVAAPGGVQDPNTANNSATDTDTLTPVVSLDYFTLVPCRVVDTRGGAPIGGPILQGQQTRTLAVAGKCGIPLTAKAIAINLVVTQPSAAGNVRLFPAGEPVPTASSINYGAGQTRANNAVIRLNASGAMAAFVGQGTGTTVHLIIDVNGYFE